MMINPFGGTGNYYSSAYPTYPTYGYSAYSPQQGYAYSPYQGFSYQSAHNGWPYPNSYSPRPASWSAGRVNSFSPRQVANQRVSRVRSKTVEKPHWENQLKRLFHNREAVIYALHIRTFAADDKNGNGIIEPQLGENGTFLKAIKLLPRLKALGVNTIHMLPINPIGKLDRLGEAGSPGSPYAPAALDRINEEYHEPGSGMTVVQEARAFVDACHKMGIHVMADIPSCGSVDLSLSHPELMARDGNGQLLTPTNWVDIRMFKEDSPELRAYYQKFFDLMAKQVGVDGFRADIGRARSLDFWRYFINQFPDKAWLAETYTEEDASPMKNLPRDLPEDLLSAGFDSIYGQFHIFHNFSSTDYMRYLLQIKGMLSRQGLQKSIIGSFLTHDDPSTMEQGGAQYCKLISAMMCVQPDTNPYILDGFCTGYAKPFDIFNYKPHPKGKYPDIGIFLKQMLDIRNDPRYHKVLTVGKWIPLQTWQDGKDPKIIAFLRQYRGRTLLVVANKDVNAYHKGIIEIPALNVRQSLHNIAPDYGKQSTFIVNRGQIRANLAPGKFYLFEVALPEIY